MKKQILIFGALSLAFIISVAGYYVRNYETHHLTTNSMYPSLEAGEIRFFKKVKKSSISRGDIVLVQIEYEGNTVRGVSRIVGLPDESVVLENEGISIDGNPYKLSEIFPGNVQPEESLIRTMDIHDSIDLSGDEYFILGDNLESALDSRIIGPLKTENIKGEMLPWLGEEKKLKTNFFE